MVLCPLGRRNVKKRRWGCDDQPDVCPNMTKLFPEEDVSVKSGHQNRGFAVLPTLSHLYQSHPDLIFTSSQQDFCFNQKWNGKRTLCASGIFFH